ncbi:MAG: phytoene dehydrogenase [Myxococcales bacterium]
MVTAPEPLPASVARARAQAPLPEHVDVAIVGAGLGGLTAGAFLARQGLRVAIFDHHYVAGGCATQFQRGGRDQRYRFDVGLHYIGDCGPEGAIPTILREVGAHVDFVPMDQDGFDTLVFPDFQFRIPANLDLYRDRLVAQFPSERRGIDRYVRLVREVGVIGRSIQRADGRLTARVGLEVLLRGRLLAANQGATIGAFLDTCTRDPKLRAIMLGQSGDYGLPPSKVSAILHCGLADHYFQGAYYPSGGGQVIADRLAETVEAAGGSIHLRHGIARIVVEGGRAVGVRTEPRHGGSHEVRARVVLSNADLRATALELLAPEDAPLDWRQRVDRYEMAAAIFITFLGIEGDLAALGMKRTNYWQFDTYDMEEVYRLPQRPEDMRVHAAYITSASLKEPGSPHHAPPGVQSAEIMTLLPGDARFWGATHEGATGWGYKRDTDYAGLKQRVEDELIARFDALFPGVAGKIVFRESATPLTHTRFTRAAFGTGYGIAATPAQFNKSRPGYRSPVQGLYLCGASTRAGHGIVGAMLSGRAAARRILADRG